VLLIAAHVLGDVDRWWRSQDAELRTDMQVGDVYQLLHRTAVEAEAAWSLLPVRSDGTRIFTTAVALLPIALQLIERHGDIVVWDIRIYPGRGTSSDST
jgi:threonine aldolase